MVNPEKQRARAAAARARTAAAKVTEREIDGWTVRVFDPGSFETPACRECGMNRWYLANSDGCIDMFRCSECGGDIFLHCLTVGPLPSEFGGEPDGSL